MRKILLFIGALGWLESLALAFYAVTLPLAGRGPLFVLSVVAFVVGSCCVAKAFGVGEDRR